MVNPVVGTSFLPPVLPAGLAEIFSVPGVSSAGALNNGAAPAALALDANQAGSSVVTISALGQLSLLTESFPIARSTDATAGAAGTGSSLIESAQRFVDALNALLVGAADELRTALTARSSDTAAIDALARIGISVQFGSFALDRNVLQTAIEENAADTAALLAQSIRLAEQQAILNQAGNGLDNLNLFGNLLPALPVDVLANVDITTEDVLPATLFDAALQRAQISISASANLTPTVTVPVAATTAETTAPVAASPTAATLPAPDAGSISIGDAQALADAVAASASLQQEFIRAIAANTAAAIAVQQLASGTLATAAQGGRGQLAQMYDSVAAIVAVQAFAPRASR